MTWGEVKNEVLHLGFADPDEGKEFAAVFPEAANYALLEIATSVKPIIKKYEFSQYPLPNLLSNTGNVFVHSDQDITFAADCPRAYYFECDGNGTATLEQNGTVLDTIFFSADGVYNAYKGFITDAGEIMLRFAGEFVYSIRNIALYKNTKGAGLIDIPAYEAYHRYDMKLLVPDFFDFDDVCLLQTNDSDEQYIMYSDFTIEQGHVLSLNSKAKGQFTVFYKAYPTKITLSTADSFILELDRDAQRLLPLLIASRIFKDDDLQKATMYFNEYQVAAEKLKLGQKRRTNDTWRSASGWW